MTQMTIGHLYTSLHAGCASAVARVLEAYEVEVEYVDLDADDIEGALEAGEIDLLVSAWFPRDEALAGPGRRVFGDLYQPVVSFGALTSLGAIGTLGADDVERILVVEEGCSALEVALKSLPSLATLPVETVGEGALIERVEAAKASHERLLVVAIQPHAIFFTDMLHLVDDPEHLLGGEMSARMIMPEAVARRTDSDLLDELSEMMLGNRVMSALDYTIAVEGQDPEGAAEAWQRGRLIGR